MCVCVCVCVDRQTTWSLSNVLRLVTGELGTAGIDEVMFVLQWRSPRNRAKLF